MCFIKMADFLKEDGSYDCEENRYVANFVFRFRPFLVYIVVKKISNSSAANRLLLHSALYSLKIIAVFYKWQFTRKLLF